MGNEVTLQTRILPTDPPYPGLLMQTAWIGSWESQFVGIGRLTAFLAAQLERFSAADDDLGLGVVFLHRHRCELGLKLLLERAGAAVLNTHDLDRLVAACESGFDGTPMASAWLEFAREQQEYLALIRQIDPDAISFRYPYDKKQRTVERAEFIDLGELAAAGTDFERAVMRVVDVAARREELALSDDEVEPTVAETAAAVRALRSMLEFLEAKETVVARHAKRLGLDLPQPDLELAGWRSKANVHAELLTRLEPALLRVLDQLESRRRDGALPPALGPDPLTPEPDTAPSTPLGAYAAIRRVDEWVGKGMGRHLRELKVALLAVHRRSSAWPRPAGRQIHTDTGRILARM